MDSRRNKKGNIFRLLIGQCAATRRVIAMTMMTWYGTISPTHERDYYLIPTPYLKLGHRQPKTSNENWDSKRHLLDLFWPIETDAKSSSFLH